MSGAKMRNIPAIKLPVQTGCISTWHRLMSAEKKEHQMRKCLCNMEPVGNFLIDWWGRAQATVGSAIPSLVVLGSIRTQDEQAKRSKPISSSFQSPLQLLPPGSCAGWVPVLLAFKDELWYRLMSEMNPFLPKLLLIMAIHHSNSNPKYETIQYLLTYRTLWYNKALYWVHLIGVLLSPSVFSVPWVIFAGGTFP